MVHALFTTDMNSKKEVTIYDIAKSLGISAATVSRALKDHPAISPKTKKRVLAAAKKSGYRSNHFASNLRRQSTHTIGVIVHELNSHFITSVLAGIETVTAGTGYDIIIGHSSESAVKEAANAHNLFHKRVDGLIASLAYDTTDLSHYEPYSKRGIPIVFFDRVEATGYGTNVVIDNYAAGYQATEHLIQQGCKRIAHITGSLNRNVYADRLKGYKAALQKHKLKYTKDFVLVNDLGEEAAIAAARQLLQIRPAPDGIFITNDFCAAMVIQTIKEAGLRIPEDIAVVGFNNDVISNLIEPKLSTIDYPGKKMGEMAAQLLMNQLTGIAVPGAGKKMVIDAALVVRGSSLKRK